MNFNYRIIVFALLALIGFQDIKAQEPIQKTISSFSTSFAHGALLGCTAISLGCAFKAAYIQYLLYTTPEIYQDPNSARRAEGDPVRLYQWDNFGHTLWALDCAMIVTKRTHNIMNIWPQDGKCLFAIAEGLINDFKNNKVALYYANGESENREKSRFNARTILNSIQHELRRITQYMKRLQPFTDIPRQLEKIMNRQSEKDASKRGAAVIKSMEDYIGSLDKYKTWGSWFFKTLFKTFEKEVAQTYWDLFLARTRLKVLEGIMIHESDRQNKEQEEHRLARHGIGKAIN